MLVNSILSRPFLIRTHPLGVNTLMNNYSFKYISIKASCNRKKSKFMLKEKKGLFFGFFSQKRDFFSFDHRLFVLDAGFSLPRGTIVTKLGSLVKSRCQILGGSGHHRCPVKIFK